MKKETEIKIQELPPYVNVRQICYYFGMEREKVWDLFLTGQLKGYKPGLKGKNGKGWIAKTQDLVDLIEKSEIMIPNLQEVKSKIA